MIDGKMPRPSMAMISPPPPGLPGPTETHITVANARSGGDTLVMMQVVTPTGVQFYFMTAQEGRRIMDSIGAACTRAETGLVTL